MKDEKKIEKEDMEEQEINEEEINEKEEEIIEEEAEEHEEDSCEDTIKQLEETLPRRKVYCIIFEISKIIKNDLKKKSQNSSSMPMKV